MTRIGPTELAIQIAEHRAKTRDETRIRLAQLEEDLANARAIIREVMIELGAARDETPIDLAKARMQERRAFAVNVADLLAQHDILYARCPVLASDVGPEHTTARVWAYALANGWALTDGGDIYRGAAFETPRFVHSFCNAHAQASGMSPLDVLTAIGAMP